MSFIQIFSLVLLVVAFGLAVWRHINVGLTTIPAAFILLLVSGTPVKTYVGHFPGSLVLLILGVTYLFGHAQRSGAIDRMTAVAVRATGRRDWALPWIMFSLAALISAIGALPAASLAIVVPIAIRTARRREISLMLMGVVTIMGALAGGFSPISVWGQLVGRLAEQADRPISQVGLFLIEFVLNLLLAVVAFVVFGGVRLARRRRDTDTSPDASPTPAAGDETPLDGPIGTVPGGGTGGRGPGLAVRSAAGDTATTTTVAAEAGRRDTTYQWASLVGTGVFVVTVLVFSLDVGLTAFLVALVLHLVFRPQDKEVLRDLPWGVVLVISGVLLYVGLLEDNGTFDAIAEHLGGISNLGLAILALAFVGSLFASFESSSVAVLGLVIPVAIQVVPPVGATSLLLILGAVSWAIVVASPSPYHLSGGLVLASSPEEDQGPLFRRLLAWALSAAVVVPLLGWLLPAFGPV